MKILLATSSVTPNAGIPSFNRELCRLLNVENEMHLLVDENIESYRGYAKIYSITGINIYPTLFIVDSFQVIKTDMGTI